MKRGMRHPDGLASKLLQYFAANPDEELSFSDASVKFDVKVRSLYARTTDLKAQGELEVVTVIRLKKHGPDLARAPAFSAKEPA